MPVLPPASESLFFFVCLLLRIFVCFFFSFNIASADSFAFAGGFSDTSQNNNHTYGVEKSFTGQPCSERSQK